MRFILAGSLLAGLNGRSVDLIARNGDARSRQGGRHRQTWRWSTPARIVGCGDASAVEVGGHRRRPGAIVGNGDAAARRARPGRLGIVGCGDARARRKKPPRGVRGGKSACGSGRKKPRRRSGRKTARPDVQLGHFSRIFRLIRCERPPWALLDLLLLFLDVLLLLVLLLVARHCCKVSDEAAFCLIQRPYISKTLLTRRISPRDHHNKMLRPGLCVVHASPQYL